MNAKTLILGIALMLGGGLFGCGAGEDCSPRDCAPGKTFIICEKTVDGKKLRDYKLGDDTCSCGMVSGDCDTCAFQAGTYCK